MSEAASASGGQSFAEASSETEPLTEKKSDLVILYTNDVHCSVDDNIGYAGLINYKKSLEADGYEVILLDAGDAIQGGILGSLTKGETIVNIMNEAGYDAATLATMNLITAGRGFLSWQPWRSTRMFPVILSI